MHKYNFLKANNPKSRIPELNRKESGSSRDRDKDPPHGDKNHPCKDNYTKENNYQKPIIKREHNNKKNYHYANNDKDSEKNVIGINKDVENLKKNLLNNANNNKNVIINPNFAFNYEKHKVKNSLEIEVNKAPKIENRVPQSKKDKKGDLIVVNVNEGNPQQKRRMIGKRKEVVNNNYVNNSKEPNNLKAQNNPSTNVSESKESVSSRKAERKRSDSKSSQEENKEKQIKLKEFMYNMKEKVIC